jgi:hypothetical protein
VGELDRLITLLGTWETEATWPPGGPGVIRGKATFAWTLGGAYLEVRGAGAHPIPDSLAVIGPARDGNGFTQHYFDERGVVRLYAMHLEDGMLTLLREEADFSPLDFSQRFVGTFSADGDRIDGRWEQRTDPAAEWALDFHLVYTRIPT